MEVEHSTTADGVEHSPVRMPEDWPYMKKFIKWSLGGGVLFFILAAVAGASGSGPEVLLVLLVLGPLLVSYIWVRIMRSYVQESIKMNQ